MSDPQQEQQTSGEARVVNANENPEFVTESCWQCTVLLRTKYLSRTVRSCLQPHVVVVDLNLNNSG